MTQPIKATKQASALAASEAGAIEAGAQLATPTDAEIISGATETLATDISATKTATISQDQVNDLIGKTRKEARDAATAKLLKDLGVSNLEEAKAKLTKAQEFETAQLTEAERLLASRKQVEDQLAQATKALADAENVRKQSMIESSIVTLASGRFADPHAVLKLIDANSITVEDGSVSGVKEALDALASKSPWTLLQKGAQVATPALGATNPNAASRTETDEDRRARYFKGGNNTFFTTQQGGVVGQK